jgi:hypothetical protein
MQNDDCERMIPRAEARAPLVRSYTAAAGNPPIRQLHTAGEPPGLNASPAESVIRHSSFVIRHSKGDVFGEQTSCIPRPTSNGPPKTNPDRMLTYAGARADSMRKRVGDADKPCIRYLYPEDEEPPGLNFNLGMVLVRRRKTMYAHRAIIPAMGEEFPENNAKCKMQNAK